MSSDSPAVIQYNSDGYELPILEGESAENIPAIISAGVDGYEIAHAIAVDETGKALNKEQNKLVPFEYDFIGMIYLDGNKLVETMEYRVGGPTGDIVATVTFTYNNKDNVTSMTRS